MRRNRLTLAEAQSALFGLVTGRAVGTAPPEAEALIVGDRRASADQRVAVYAFMYRDRLREALASQFPRLAELLGHRAFAELANGYGEAHPSTHPSLRSFGAGLADWLSRRLPEMACSDLAKLEWARSDLFDAVDEATCALDEIRAWPPAQFAELPIKLIGAHRLLDVAGGTAELWRRIGAGEAARADPRGTSVNPESILVWRQGVAVYHRNVTVAEQQVLALAATGTCVGRMCETIAVQTPTEDAARQAFTWIWTWANDELLQQLAPAG